MPNDPPTRVCVLADSDTRWKWGVHTARQLFSDAHVVGRLLVGRATPTQRQLDEMGLLGAEIAEVTLPEFLLEQEEQPHDVLIVSTQGGGIQATLHALADLWGDEDRRTLVITGYVGVVYERQTDGLLLRAGADVILANSPADARDFRRVLAGVGADPDTVVETRLPYLVTLGASTDAPSEAGRAGGRVRVVTFATQPDVPRQRDERAYALSRLIRHASTHPDRDVICKMRSRPGEQTTHIEEHPYERLGRESGTTRPDNLSLVYGPMPDVLDRTDLLVTVSSTAAVESLARGIPTAVLTDFGVREQLGNHYFVGSGCLTSFDALDDGFVPTADPEWLADRGVTVRDEPRLAAERVRSLVGTALPPLQPFYSMANAGGYLPGLLSRYGLDTAGQPLATGAPGAAAPVLAATRRIRRRAVRRATRIMVPHLRRWAEL